MTIPAFQMIMLPFLKFAGDGKIHSISEVTDALSEEFRLTQPEIEELIPSGVPRFANRVSWVKTHLKKAGLIDYPQRSRFVITLKGKSVLKENPTRIDLKFLSRFPEYKEFRAIRNVDGVEGQESETNQDLSPEETIEKAYNEIRAGLADELLDYVIKSTPTFFEKLVVELLVAMGYGGNQENAARAVGRSGDEGIDGIIDEDKLGLDSVYVQAKRYQRDSKIGAHNIRDFVGALVGARANKGVFITTADFTKEAVDFISKVNSRVVLINGTRLANLMIDYGIGVSTRIKYEIKKMDTDYFSDNLLV